jgi:pimeloyl-ACP methyl ester carboxylesterase
MTAPVLAPEPPLPLGERIELAGRGTTFVRRIEGPPGAPTVVLLHGWIASGGLNWFNAFDALAEHYSVIAPDLRGPGRGIRSRRRFRLADCADDVAALLEHLGTGPVIAVGYSMGGPVAQLLWHRHRHLVDGLVFCATSDRFLVGARERMIFGTVMASAVGTTRTGEWVGRWPGVRSWAPRGSASRPTNLRDWAAGEMRRHDVVKLMEAGQAIGSYNARRWIQFVDVPTTVMVTDRDRAIRPEEQLRMAAAIPGAVLHHIDDGHVVCAKRGFGRMVVRAVDSVAGRVPSPLRLVVP